MATAQGLPLVIPPLCSCGLQKLWLVPLGLVQDSPEWVAAVENSNTFICAHCDRTCDLRKTLGQCGYCDALDRTSK